MRSHLPGRSDKTSWYRRDPQFGSALRDFGPVLPRRDLDCRSSRRLGRARPRGAPWARTDVGRAKARTGRGGAWSRSTPRPRAEPAISRRIRSRVCCTSSFVGGFVGPSFQGRPPRRPGRWRPSRRGVGRDASRTARGCRVWRERQRLRLAVASRTRFVEWAEPCESGAVERQFSRLRVSESTFAPLRAFSLVAGHLVKGDAAVQRQGVQLVRGQAQQTSQRPVGSGVRMLDPRPGRALPADPTSDSGRRGEASRRVGIGTACRPCHKPSRRLLASSPPTSRPCAAPPPPSLFPLRFSPGCLSPRTALAPLPRVASRRLLRPFRPLPSPTLPLDVLLRRPASTCAWRRCCARPT